MPAVTQTELKYEIKQHLGWLRSYVEQMDANNWRDMRLRCEQQLTQLSTALEKR